MSTDPEDELRNPLHTKEGLAEYLDATIKRPTALSREEYDALKPRKRAAYNEKRLDYISGGLTVNTPDMVFATTYMARAKRANRQKPLGTSGLIVSGLPTVGKTTILTTIMKNTWHQAKSKYSGIDHNRVPVVFIEVPSGSTGRLLMAELARFFGFTVTRSDTKDMLEHRVINAIHAARTELIVIDELHNLDASNRGNGESINALKILQNKVRADFVYAGINLESSDLFQGIRGRQISGRFAVLNVDLYDLYDPEQASIWGGVIDAFEKALPLIDHKPGALRDLVPYLHDRTNGNLASLNMLLTWAAGDLIEGPPSQPEALTQAVLRLQTLDVTAETHYKKTQKTLASGKNKGKAPAHA